jgi:probable HAF family extracellular repeat protein
LTNRADKEAKMNKQITHLLLLLIGMTLLSGCGGDSGSTSNAQALLDGDAPIAGTAPAIVPAGELGDLTDLGDLLAPQGDHWYYTRPTAINDNGIVVGQSNAGSPPKAAFMWDPATDVMTYLGMHPWVKPYNDYYFRMNETPVDPVGFVSSEAVDLNMAGDVICNSLAGDITDEMGKRAFILQSGLLVDLPPVLQLYDGDPEQEVEIRPFSEAIDINEKGEVVLTADDSEGRHAYYWDGLSYYTATLIREDFTFFDVTDVPVYWLLGGIVGEDSAAVAINENGQVAINSGSTAIYHDRNSTPDVFQPLNHLPGATNTAAVDINDSAYTNNDGIPDGHIIGNSGTSESLTIDDGWVRGFFWDGGAMYPVDHLGGGNSVTTDINNQDQVVGASTTASGAYHAILWTLDAITKKGVIRDLGTLGGNYSYATAINEAGQITGWSETGDVYSEADITVAVRHAFLWNDGVMYDLGTHSASYDYPFIPTFPHSQGNAINAAGEVTGSSITINAHPRGFYLSPTFP